MIRFSEIDQFMRCEFAWHLRYRMHLVPKKPMRAPLLGSAVHAGVAAALCSRISGQEDPAYSGRTVSAMYVRTSLGKIAEPDDDTIAEHEDAERKAPLIVERILTAFPAERYETVLHNGTPAVELELTNHHPPMIAHIDWICRDREEDLTWIVDWKVRNTLQQEGEDLDLQAMVYQFIARDVAPIVGTMNVQVSAELPADPKLNKDGTMSRSAIRTDWATYRAALIRARLNPREYEDMERKLEKVEFMRIQQAARTWDFVHNVINDVVIPQWVEMNKVRSFRRHLSKFNCARCQYVPLCLGELRGEDATWIAETQYNKEEA